MSTTIYFQDIYTKAIGLFDDPKITVAYDTNKIQFAKLMYVYFQNSISLFNNPLSVVELISNYQDPVGKMEIFQGDGETNSFILDKDFEIIDNSNYIYTINGENVQGTIDVQERTITFPVVPKKGTECSIEQYFGGKFDCDTGVLLLKKTAEKNVINYIKDILARLLVKSWGEATRNFLLDIQNILTDSDFKLHSSSSALRAKDAWIAQLNSEILYYQNKLAWNIRMFKEL